MKIDALVLAIQVLYMRNHAFDPPIQNSEFKLHSVGAQFRFMTVISSLQCDLE